MVFLRIWQNPLARLAVIPAMTSPALVASVPAHAVTYFTVEEAQKECFPKANRFVESHVIFSEAQIKAIEQGTKDKVRTKGQQVWKAFAGEEFQGFFMVDYVIGKHEIIDYAVSLSPQGAVQEIAILAYRESYGGEIRNESWRKQFRGKTTHDPVELNRDIVNIGGATLSCRHVTEGVKRLLFLYELILKNDLPNS